MVVLICGGDNIFDKIVNLCIMEVFYEIKRKFFNFKLKCIQDVKFYVCKGN